MEMVKHMTEYIELLENRRQDRLMDRQLNGRTNNTIVPCFGILTKEQLVMWW